MSVVVKDMATVPAEAQALPPSGSEGLQMFERLAKDQSVDVDKLDRLMQLHERATARFAQEQFNAAMAAAQKEMRAITADAYNPQTKSRYASYAALDAALRPIYTEHGFGLSFNTGECPLPEMVRVICDVTHVGGHEKPYHIDMPADGKGAKGGDVMTRTHATGAAVSYGMRYLLKMIFNVAVGESDDDGNSATAKAQPVKPAPAGFDNWLTDLHSAADTGTSALRDAWKASPAELRAYFEATRKGAIEVLKSKAATADKAARS